MPFDMPAETTIVPARIIARLARAGVLNDAAGCDTFLGDRFCDRKRITWMSILHPTAYVGAIRD